MHQQIQLRYQQYESRANIIRVLGGDAEVRAMKKVMDDYRNIRRVLEAQAPHAALAAVKKSKKTSIAANGTGATTAVSVGETGEGGGSGDGDDGGDGDGDGDGPRRPSRPHSRRKPASRPSIRASQRFKLPLPLTRRAFAWLLALALLLAHLTGPLFAALYIQLGQPELAHAVLGYRPNLLMPVPPGWTK